MSNFQYSASNNNSNKKHCWDTALEHSLVGNTSKQDSKSKQEWGYIWGWAQVVDMSDPKSVPMVWDFREKEEHLYLGGTPTGNVKLPFQFKVLWQWSSCQPESTPYRGTGWESIAARKIFKYLLVSWPLCYGRTEKTVNVQCALLAGLEKLGPTSLRTPKLSALGVSMRKRCYPPENLLLCRVSQQNHPKAEPLYLLKGWRPQYYLLGSEQRECGVFCSNVKKKKIP